STASVSFICTKSSSRRKLTSPKVMRPTVLGHTSSLSRPTNGERAGEERSMKDSLSVLPEGVGPPPDVPAAIFVAALQTFLEMRRLDMGALAVELGMARSSLYRRARSRDHLLSAVLSYLTRRAIVRALDAAAGLTGAERVITVVDHLLHDVHGQASLRHLLHEEPEAALRILTSKSGL